MVEGDAAPRRNVLTFLEEAWAVSGGPDLLGLTRHDPKKKYKGECARAHSACRDALSAISLMPTQHALSAHGVQTRAASLVSLRPLCIVPPSWAPPPLAGQLGFRQ